MTSIHLLVLIHGLWGIPDHVAELAQIIRETYTTKNPEGVKLQVLVTEQNRRESTIDGVDWGGERVAQEVLDKVKDLESGEEPKVVKFSIMGYSLGGLVARYVIGILHQRGFFENVTPVNFYTIATPHIGLPRYSSLISSLVASLAPQLLSRTGEQLYCVDRWSAAGRPLIEVMSDPNRIFYQGLAKFQHLRIYANAINDTVVPYVTAAIEVDDPFATRETNGIKVELREEYSQMVKTHTLPPIPVPRPQDAMIFSPTWFRNHSPTIPFLPPTLRVRFPLNVGLYPLLPIIIPTGILVTVAYLIVATRSSRARAHLLESDESNKGKLIHTLAELENEVENAVVGLIDGHDPSPAHDNAIFPPEQPILTRLQRNIATSLNRLPFKKELAYIDKVRNSHAVILCRDLHAFDAHKMGAGVALHWAASFIF